MNLRKIRDDDGDDLGLSLSLELKCPSQKSPKHKPSLNDIAFQSSTVSRPSSFRGPNMNKMLEVEPPPRPTISLSPDSTITCANGKRSERDEFGFERQSTNSEGGGGDDSSARKKLRLTKEQAAVLEETFKHQCTLNQNQKMVLGRQLKLQTRQVEVWFQNRRARTKFKKTEVDYVFLKRRCEDLTNENTRLQKQVAELRALKYSPHMKPPTTLSLCPPCEHMAKVPISSLVTSSTPPSATGTSTQRHVIPSDQKASRVSNWFINRLQESRRPCE